MSNPGFVHFKDGNLSLAALCGKGEVILSHGMLQGMPCIQILPAKEPILNSEIAVDGTPEYDKISANQDIGPSMIICFATKVAVLQLQQMLTRLADTFDTPPTF